MGVDPITMAIMGAQVVGGTVSAIGGIREAEAQRQAALYQAGVARNMAQFAEYQGQKEAERQLMKTGQLVAEQRVAAAANGVDVNVGSAYDLQVSAGLMGQQDAQMIRENARNRANSYASQSQLYEMEAKTARSKGFLDAFSSIMGTASSVGSTYSNWQTVAA